MMKILDTEFQLQHVSGELITSILKKYVFIQVLLLILKKKCSTIIWKTFCGNLYILLQDVEFYDYTEEDREYGALLTPTLFFVHEGEIKDKLFGGNISGIDLDSMIMKYRLDEVK